MPNKDVEYIKIDSALTRLEQGKYAIHSVDWYIGHIDWAWKWRKITKEQMEELAERACALLDAELCRIDGGKNEQGI